MRQSNPKSTKDRDQAPAQKTKKPGQRKNNHRKNKVTTRDVISDEMCNEMREQRDKNRQNEINKPCSHP